MKQDSMENQTETIRLNAFGFPTFYGVFVEYKEQCVNYKRHWDENTTLLQYTSIIENIIVPCLDRHDQRNIRDYTLEEFEQVLKKLRKKGKEESTVNKYRHIIRTVVTVGAINSLCDDLFGELDEKTKDRKSSKKQESYGVKKVPPRSLKPIQEKMVYRYLRSRVKNSGPALGLWLMYNCGLRNQEACGANFHSFYELEEWPGQYVLEIPESTKSGTSQEQIGGKTYNTGRVIYLYPETASLLLELQEERKKSLTDQGKEIPDKLPIVCDNSDLLKRCQSTDLTKAAREMFLEIGMRRDDLKALAWELWREANRAVHQMMQTEFGLVEKEPTAYLLRRHYATMLEALNLTDSEKQYLMGHRIEDAGTVRTDYRDEALYLPMVEKLMNRPLLGQKPGEILLNGNLEMTVRAEQTIRIPEGVSRINLDIRALEPETSIRLSIAHEGEVRVEYGISYDKVSPHPPQELFIDKLLWDMYQDSQTNDGSE